MIVTRLVPSRNYPGMVTVVDGTRSWKIMGEWTDEQAIAAVTELLNAEADRIVGSEAA